MANVKIHKNPEVETPSQSIVKAASQVFTVTDARGRVIGIKKMGPLDRLRLFEAVGPENSKNEAYLGYASLAFHVSSIENEPVSRPSNKLQLESLIQRLDDDGIEAVATGIQEHFSTAVSTDDEAQAALKNS